MENVNRLLEELKVAWEAAKVKEQLAATERTLAESTHESAARLVINLERSIEVLEDLVNNREIREDY